jgi:hypothetical protein
VRPASVWRGIVVGSLTAAVAWLSVAMMMGWPGTVEQDAVSAWGDVASRSAMFEAAGLGVLGAAVAAALAGLALGAMVRRPAVAAGVSPAVAGIQAGASVTKALVYGLLSKLVVLAIGVGTLFVVNVKFPLVATFALAFAGASLWIQLVSASLLDRALSGRGSRVAQPASRAPHSLNPPSGPPGSGS